MSDVQHITQQQDARGIIMEKKLFSIRGASLVVLFLLFYIPFIDKAFHIDDVTFIKMSRMIGWNPLDAVPVDFPYSGSIIENMLPYEITHPLFVPYYIKVIRSLTGESEIVLHLSFLIFPFIALLSFYLLFQKLYPSNKGTMLATIFLGCSPAFLVNSQNVMTDVPTFAFMLLSFLLYVEAVKKPSPMMAYLGAAAMSVALFASYHILVFVPLILIYALLQKKLNRHIIVSLMIPGTLMFLWLLLVYQEYGIFIGLKSNINSSGGVSAHLIRQGLSPSVLLSKFIFNLTMVGTFGMLLLPLNYFRKKAGFNFLKTFPPILIVTSLLLLKYTSYKLPSTLFLSAMVSVGIYTLLDTSKMLFMGKIDTQRSSNLFLFSWIVIVFVYNEFIFGFGAARYLLPILPPLIMATFGNVELELNTYSKKILLMSVFIFIAVFGFASAYSDYKYANTYRTAADAVKDYRDQAGNSVDAWYIGEWGMIYYMEKVGAKYLTAESTEPRLGDIIVIPDMPRFWMPSYRLRPNLKYFSSLKYSSSLPLRLFNRRSNAGFYCSGFGLLPFSFSLSPDEIFDVYVRF